MGPASAYSSVLESIDKMIRDILLSKPEVFSFDQVSDGIVEIRDFQTTGVVAFAFGLPFTEMTPRRYDMPGRSIQIKDEYLKNCADAMNNFIVKL